jgi:hypothetical protein
MKIDKKSIDMLLGLNDDNLWKALQYAISKSNNDMLKGIERPADMTKLRETLSSLTDKDIEKITSMLNGGKK